MRILALLAAYNEERFIGACLDHLADQGIEAYLCDNESTDRTVEIAERHRGGTLRGIESIPRDGVFRWRTILERKEELAATLEADWYMHLDPDSIPLGFRPGQSLAEALAEADASGSNAVDFAEFTFVPTREEPDHEHPEFRRTLRSYYPFAPGPLHRVIAWKRQAERVDLAGSGGHAVAFPGRAIAPEVGRLLHYLFLSRQHALEKYVGKVYDSQEVLDGWHGWRATLTAEEVRLPPASALHRATSDDRLDGSSPRATHWLFWETAR